MSDSIDRETRREIAELLQSRSADLARTITDEFLERHPEWTERYGAAARTRGEEDAQYHLKFLAGAILTGSVAPFEDYARWTAGVLDARGIERRYLAENFEQIGRAARGALTNGDGHAVIDRWIAAGVEAVNGTGSGPDDSAPAREEWAAERGLYLQAIRTGERRAAVNIVSDALERGASVPDLYQHILQPAQHELGRLWERNEITVATEHMGTAITQYVMAQLYMHLDIPDASHGNAIVTGVQGELHQIGAHMIADVLSAAGWNVRFLGTQLPHADVVAAVEDHGARLVGISATVLSSLSEVADLIRKLRARFGTEVAILVGGGAYRADPEAWREVGADGYAGDIAEAVEAASRFVAKAG